MGRGSWRGVRSRVLIMSWGRFEPLELVDSAGLRTPDISTPMPLPMPPTPIPPTPPLAPATPPTLPTPKLPLIPFTLAMPPAPAAPTPLAALPLPPMPNPAPTPFQLAVPGAYGNRKFSPAWKACACVPGLGGASGPSSSYVLGRCVLYPKLHLFLPQGLQTFLGDFGSEEMKQRQWFWRQRRHLECQRTSFNDGSCAYSD